VPGVALQYDAWWAVVDVIGTFPEIIMQFPVKIVYGVGAITYSEKSKAYVF